MSRILYPVSEAAQQLGVSVTTTRALIMSGALRSVKIGQARRVPADALHEYVQRLDAEQNGDSAGVAAPAPSVEAPNAIRL
jgi:excisionase family DNA binding protein